MFYLKEFLKLCKLNTMLLFIFTFALVGLVTTTMQKRNIEKKISLVDQTKVIPYFNALVHGDVRLDYVKRKMKSLPGVHNVSISRLKKFKTEIQKLEKSFGSQILSQFSDKSYQKIKIELAGKTDKGNQSLIREYLERLVGKDYLTLGAVKMPRTLDLKSNGALISILKWSQEYLSLLFMTFMGISLCLILKPLNNQAYIIEKFQRRSHVNFKIMLAGSAVVIFIATAVNIFWATSLEPIILLPIIYSLIVISLMTLSQKLKFRV